MLSVLSSCKEQESNLSDLSSLSDIAESSVIQSGTDSSNRLSDLSSEDASSTVDDDKTSSNEAVSSKKPVSSKASRPASSLAASSKTESKPIYKSTLDYHNLPDSALQLYSNLDFDENDITLYHKIVDAYLNFETSVPFDTATQLPHSVLRLL